MRKRHRYVTVIVSDGSKAYKSAIDVHLGRARHVLDRFHAIRWFSAGLTPVRNPPVSMSGASRQGCQTGVGGGVVTHLPTDLSVL